MQATRSNHQLAGSGRVGYPVRGFGWGFLIAVVAALVLFAGVLVVESGGRSPVATAPAGVRPAPVTPVGSAGPNPPAGAVVAGGVLTAGWQSAGWSWDSTIEPSATAPDGVPAVSVTYLKPYAGFALRSDGLIRPPAGATLTVRLRLAGPPIRLGLQTQTADAGRAGPVVQVAPAAGRWTTVSVPVTALKAGAGIRRVSVIAQNAASGTHLWVSDVTLH